MDSGEFILAIKDRPAIWMNSHPHHKFKYSVMSAWMEVKALYPEYSIDYLKKRWKGLKDTYRKELRKHPDLQSGELPADINVKWRYFKLLHFLREELIFTGEGSNPSEVNQYGEESSQSTDLETCSRPENTKPSFSVDAEIETKPEKMLRKNNKRTRHDDSHTIRKKVKTETPEESPTKSKPERETRSPDYYFLMSILPQMEKLPPIQKLRLRNKINEALIEEMEKNKDVNCSAQCENG